LPPIDLHVSERIEEDGLEPTNGMLVREQVVANLGSIDDRVFGSCECHECLGKLPDDRPVATPC
jgi:hypothetical protein